MQRNAFVITVRLLLQVIHKEGGSSEVQYRDIVKIIDVKLREITTVLQVIHKEGGSSEIRGACDKSKTLLLDVKDGYGKLSDKVQSLSYHRFNDHWKFISQRVTFLIALINYLESGTLATLDQVTEI
ncbi:translin, partial [Diaphorina citri]|uniref:Translin n=1 Tax=Diaphorina citri TaxID=121845 RepID=A0A3Q0JL67_DIACI